MAPVRSFPSRSLALAKRHTSVWTSATRTTVKTNEVMRAEATRKPCSNALKIFLFELHTASGVLLGFGVRNIFRRKETASKCHSASLLDLKNKEKNDAKGLSWSRSLKRSRKNLRARSAWEWKA